MKPFLIAPLLALTLALVVGRPVAAEPARFTTLSHAGVAGDAITGATVQADGSIVLAGTVKRGPLVERVRTIGRAADGGAGVVLRLSPDGRELLSATRLPAEQVRDLDTDDAGNLYLAVGPAGLLKLDPTASEVLWHVPSDGHVERIDAGPTGWVAALQVDRVDDTKPGSGHVAVVNPAGKVVATYRGHRDTLDVAVDEASKTVCTIGWRQTSARDPSGKRFPVQIAYVRGHGFDGQLKYTAYDWPNKPEGDTPDDGREGWLNQHTNNMADTRGYRCDVGGDGKLYAAFEAAGGNHIFRWLPFDVGEKARTVGGDKYHEFYNSRAEHKTVVVALEPGTGTHLATQQFAGRLDAGRTNAVRVKAGAVEADADGRVAIGGGSASGLPMTLGVDDDPHDYDGGGYLWLQGDDMATRELVTRVQPGATTHALASRPFDGGSIVVMAGSISSKNATMALIEPLQDRGEPTGGFFAVIHLGDPKPKATAPAPRPADATPTPDHTDSSQPDPPSARRTPPAPPPADAKDPPSKDELDRRLEKVRDLVRRNQLALAELQLKWLEDRAPDAVQTVLARDVLKHAQR